MFDSPLFADLGAKQARVVTSWNVMTSGDDELGRLTQYLNAAQAHGVEPLVSFEHARGDASRCKQRDKRKPQCKLPSARAYEKNFKLFRAAFPQATVISPWNEANHFTQPTWKSPKAAARFTDIAARNCRGCTIVAADILDQADSMTASRPTFGKTVQYVKQMRKYLKTKRTVCGVHNYSDVNRFRDTGTKAIIRALGCKQIWLTETGGLYRFGSFWTKKTKKGCKTNAACQLKATKYMFTLARKNPKIKRVYNYTFFGNVTPRFDAGIVDIKTGRTRPAFTELKKHL
jgi:hypothetical protein